MVWIKKHYHIILLIIIWLLLCINNYTPNTFLSGWDTLHPEFNFGLAFSRMFDGVWRADQGLGAVMTQAHMTDIPRTLILYVLSYVLPINMLRYSYVFICLLIGPMSIYFLLRKILSNTKYSQIWINNASLASSIWYLCNLGTVQHFILEIEIYPAQYAFAPLLLLWTIVTIQSFSRRNLLILASINILLSMQAHTPTFFYIFAICYGLFLALFTIANYQRDLIKKTVILMTVFVCMNLYWLLPNIYTAMYHGNEIRESKVNRLFTPDAIAKSKSFGTIDNLVYLKNFLFDWGIYEPNSEGSYSPVMSSWIKHLDNPSTFVPPILFLVMIVGIYATVRKKQKDIIPFLIFLFFPAVMLLNGTWGIRNIFDLFANISPIASEVLRFTFTKFSIPYMIGFSIIFGHGSLYLSSKLKKYVSQNTFLIILIVFQIIFFIPAFKGNLIHEKIRIQIPNQYFKLFSFLNNQNHSERVAMLPVHSFWNWTYYKWGYQGAGFLQFGIPQPILDRDYDRWNPDNEQYFREMSYAVYSQKPQLIRQLLGKYNIKWILLDRSIVDPGKVDSSRLDWLIPDLLKQTNAVKLSEQFGSDLFLYKVLDNTQDTHISQNTISSIDTPMFGSPIDSYFIENGNYIVTKPTDHQPQRTYFDKYERYTGPIVNPTKLFEVSSINMLSDISQCDPNESGLINRTTDNDSINYFSRKGTLCDGWTLDSLDHSKNYVFQITSKNIKGFPLQICIENLLTRHCTLYVNLHNGNEYMTESFYIFDTNDFGSGYRINLVNHSVTQDQSINALKNISVFEVDTSLDNIRQQSQTKFGFAPITIISKSNTNIYATFTQHDYQSNLIANIDSAFEPGWFAYAFSDPPNIFQRALPLFSGKNMGDHVLVNNWSNGWKIPFTEATNQTKYIVFIFWPQYLQYAGFTVLFLTIFWLAAKSYKENT